MPKHRVDILRSELSGGTFTVVLNRASCFQNAEKGQRLSVRVHDTHHKHRDGDQHGFGGHISELSPTEVTMKFTGMSSWPHTFNPKGTIVTSLSNGYDREKIPPEPKGKKSAKLLLLLALLGGRQT